MTKEQEMIAAHQQALLDANEHFAELASRVMNRFQSDDAQFSYLASYIRQLGRSGEGTMT